MATEVSKVTEISRLKPGSFVYITNQAARQDPQMVPDLWRGGTIKEIKPNGVAVVEVVKHIEIHTTFLVDPTDPEAYDPIL